MLLVVHIELTTLFFTGIKLFPQSRVFAESELEYKQNKSSAVKSSLEQTVKRKLR